MIKYMSRDGRSKFHDAFLKGTYYGAWVGTFLGFCGVEQIGFPAGVAATAGILYIILFAKANEGRWHFKTDEGGDEYDRRT